MKVRLYLIPLLILFTIGCGLTNLIQEQNKDSYQTDTYLDQEEELNTESFLEENTSTEFFRIEKNTDTDLKYFDRKIVVFGIPIYAAPQVSEKNLIHAANIMAEYLDNDENGQIDNPHVVESMVKNGAFLIMWGKESDLNRINPPDNRIGQDLGNAETKPNWHTNGHNGRFDASIEEIWHLISHAGYTYVYPEVFGEQPGSVLTNTMDLARGGQFLKTPNQYPDSAWYTYDDRTCDYECMATEYFYWGLTSLLGGQENRGDEISHEWQAYTPELLKLMDPALVSILSDPAYHLPQKLPDGKYQP